MYENNLAEKLVESNARMLVNALNYKKMLEQELGKQNLADSVRERFQSELERAAYQVKLGTEFRLGCLEYQESKQVQPEVKQYQTIETRLVA